MTEKIIKSKDDEKIMNEIYVIISGEYSDWSIQGYVATEEEAIKVCAHYNEHKFKYSDEWYYIEVSLIDKPKEDIDIVCVHGIIFDNINRATLRPSKKYEMRTDDFHEISYFSKTDKRLEQVKIIEERAYDRIVVNVILDENNLDRAKKIAQDRLYKYLAEKEGII